MVAARPKRTKPNLASSRVQTFSESTYARVHREESSPSRRQYFKPKGSKLADAIEVVGRGKRCHSHDIGQRREHVALVPKMAVSPMFRMLPLAQATLTKLRLLAHSPKALVQNFETALRGVRVQPLSNKEAKLAVCLLLMRCRLFLLPTQ